MMDKTKLAYKMASEIIRRETTKLDVMGNKEEIPGSNSLKSLFKELYEIANALEDEASLVK